MKKWMLLALAACMLLVTACGAAGNDAQNAHGVFEKSIQAMEDVNSFSMDMDVEQEISFGEEALVTVTKMNGDVIVEPMAMHQKMSMSLADQGTMDMEMYLTEEGIYMWEEASDMWMKMPQELFGEIMSLEEMQTNPYEELEKLQQYVDDFSYTEKNDYYVLTLSASGDKFKELITDAVAEITGTDELLQEMMEEVQIHQIDYEIKIDKETYYQQELKMNMDFSLTIDGEAAAIKQTVVGTFSNFDQISEIVVPQEVLDSAIEMNF